MKRQADKQLNKDDWGEQETSASPESILDTIASEKIMKERILKRAKLGGSTQVESESPPLKLFSQGFLTGQTSATKDFSIKAAPTSKPTSSMMEDYSQDSAGSQENKASQANSVCSDDVSITDCPDDAFSRNISRLNTAVSKWIASQVLKNPICDLTPIFSDYQRYFKEFNREAHPSPTASASPVNNNNHTDTPYRPTQEISTVTPVVETADKSVSSQPLRGLLFSKPSTQVHSFSSPSTQPSKLFSAAPSESRPLRFNPLSKPPQPSRLPTPPSSAAKSDPPLLKTGSCLEILQKPVSAKKDDLSGQEAPTTSAIAATSSTAVPLLSLSIPGVRPLATASAFSFTPRPLPIFPSAPTFSDLSSPRSAAFSLPKSSLGSFIQKPLSPEADGDEGDDDRAEIEKPHSPPALKLDTENTVFTCNCKLYLKRSESFADIGICILRVRNNPETNKTQLLVRNNTTFAKILINTIINSATPISMPRDKEVIIICPIQETDTSEQDGSSEGNKVLEMDTFLIRVKTPTLASRLHALLDEAKRKTQ